MKLKKLIYSLCLVLPLAFASCSDSEDVAWNSASDVKVDFAEQTSSFKENKGIVTIPIVCSGEMNGRVQVVVALEEVGANPAKADRNYLLTSDVINIDPETKTASVELTTVDDSEINENRTFNIVIKEVRHASAGAATTCAVTLKDNDAAFYEKLQGKFTLSALTSKGAAFTEDVVIVGADEGDPAYDKTLYITGMKGYSWTALEVSYSYDLATRKGGLVIPFGTVFATDCNFGDPIGVCDIVTGTVANNMITTEGSIAGTWSDDFNTITFETKTPLYLWLVTAGTADFNGYSWGNYFNIVLTRK